ncbi:unnamed protein product [Acanthoscelides obtectus]|uniref:Uncharacterized protein n=1 Tax=Acanthoscelides obtectus TaxID=200917 RepID=A0A9P0L713_ACAOB|nr:unnamed protein product [Acanthoscelides obtectus]CAK1669811.1 hypothetical protein AOBTE_LOCUS27261 [Acanthoscelides obtectus]
MSFLAYPPCPPRGSSFSCYPCIPFRSCPPCRSAKPSNPCAPSRPCTPCFSICSPCTPCIPCTQCTPWSRESSPRREKLFNLYVGEASGAPANEKKKGKLGKGGKGEGYKGQGGEGGGSGGAGGGKGSGAASGGKEDAEGETAKKRKSESGVGGAVEGVGGEVGVAGEPERKGGESGGVGGGPEGLQVADPVGTEEVGGPGDGGFGQGGTEEVGGEGVGAGETIPGVMGTCTPRRRCQCKKKKLMSMQPFPSWSPQYASRTPYIGGRNCNTCGSPKKPPHCSTCGRIRNAQSIVCPPTSTLRDGYSQPRRYPDQTTGGYQPPKNEHPCEEVQGCILPGWILGQIITSTQDTNRAHGHSGSRDDSQRYSTMCSRQSSSPQTHGSSRKCCESNMRQCCLLGWAVQTKADEESDPKFYYRFQDKECKKHNASSTILQQQCRCAAL